MTQTRLVSPPWAIELFEKGIILEFVTCGCGGDQLENEDYGEIKLVF